MAMRIASTAACLLLLASGARAQRAAERIVSAPAAIAAPAALSPLSAAAATPNFAPALVSPALSAVPSILAAPALAAVSEAAPVAAPALAADSAPGLLSAWALATPTFAAAASAPEKVKSPSGEHAAAALSEFSRLVAELMSGDAARSKAAVVELNKIKAAHLNKDPDPERTKVLELKPMQIPAGMYEVQDKARDVRDMKKKDVDDWLREKSVPILEDYKARKRPVDHHHEARSTWEADYDEVYTHHYFDDDLHRKIKGLSRDEFYAVTRAMGLFYDRDQYGVGPHDPNHLPEDVRGMADDPFRSVAWQVRKRGGYEKSDEPFAEFQWAQYFRERLKTYPTRADFEKAVVEAMRLVHDPAAKGLPGYKPK